MKYRKVWLGGAIALTICAIGVAFAKPLNVANMLFRARAATYTGEKITFDRSNSTRSGTTNTTTGTTFTGGGIICKTYDNDTTQSNGYVDALKYGSSIRFYEADGVTEYTFEDLDIIRFFYSGKFGFYLHVTYTDGEIKRLGGPYSTTTTTEKGRALDFRGGSFKDVANIWVECMSDSSNVCQMTKIEIEYNCTSKYQTGTTITTAPTKTSYFVGESFDPTGMVVKAQYSNSTSVATTSYTYSPTRPLTSLDEYITVYFGGYSAQQPITMVTVDSLFVYTAPTRTTYVEGDYFDPTGMVVKGVYSDGVTRTITGYTCSPSRALTTSDTAITITYDGVTTTQAITVNQASSSFDDTGVYSMTTTYNNITYTLYIDFDNLLHTMEAGSNTYRIHFTYVITDKNITFTADYRSGDNDYANFGRYRIFYDEDDNVNNTGTISENNETFNLTLYRSFGGKVVTGTYTFSK